MSKPLWSLPTGVEELAPPQARALEVLRRELLDLMHGWGYQLIMPPFIEYLSNLFAGAGADYELETFTLVDQGSGRLLGLRPDMTPQAARFDALLRTADEPSRLCYSGTVLRARLHEAGESRAPLQLGAEIFGHNGVAADAEVIELMLAVLKAAGIEDVHLDLGHVGIFRALVANIDLDDAQEAALFDALQRKSVPDLSAVLESVAIEPGVRAAILALTELNGGVEVLAQARERLIGAAPAVAEALDELATIADQLGAATVHIDLAELRGYRYQTAIVFAAYTPGFGREIARGGRYDLSEQGFEQGRPGTGFSTDLRTLFQLGGSTPTNAPGILAPAGTDAALSAAVQVLRDAGEPVLRALDENNDPACYGCDRVLRISNGAWVVETA